jgi:hypothetical protein
MQPISSLLPSLPSASDLQLLPTGFRKADVLRVKASTETHTDLTVLTAGGDRVTLSAESLLRASYTSNSDGTASKVQRSNSIVVSVQGELDPQEEADLQLLVEKLDKVVKQFLAGDLDGALSKALQLGDLGTVASFQLNVQESEQIAIAQKQSISADEVQALQPQTNLLSQIVDSINDANIDLDKLLQRLPEVLRQVFEQIEPNVSDNSLSQLFSAVESLLRQTSQLSHSTSPEIDTAP